MADTTGNKDLSLTTGEVLLTQIKEAADGVTTAAPLKDLADAYATVVGAMPKHTGRVSSF